MTVFMGFASFLRYNFALFYYRVPPRARTPENLLQSFFDPLILGRIRPVKLLTFDINDFAAQLYRLERCLSSCGVWKCGSLRAAKPLLHNENFFDHGDDKHAVFLAHLRRLLYELIDRNMLDDDFFARDRRVDRLLPGLNAFVDPHPSPGYP